MNYATTQLAEARRQELTAQATYYRQARRQRGARSHPRRPMNAFHAWLAAGQL